MAGHLKRMMAGAALLSVVGLAPALAQDSGANLLADLKQHVAAAHQAAGKDFGWAADMLCLNAVYGGDVIGEFYAGKRMSDADEDFEPVQVFDGVYYVGLREIGAYAVKTSAGVVLIDTLLPGQTESLLIPHLKKVGIDPSQIKYVIVTHGHADHFGGARYIQDHFKAKVALTAPDWDLVEKLPQTGDDAPPRRDQVVADGDRITVGDHTFTIVFIPGHTPGALAVLMAVKDHGVPHTAMLLGGAGWGLAAMPMPMRPIYANSLLHMQAVAEANHVDVALENHPFLSNSLLRMAQLRDRKPGAPNPLVIGEDGYRRYVTVFKECHAASTDRYRMLAAKYGPDPKAWPGQFVE